MFLASEIPKVNEKAPFLQWEGAGGKVEPWKLVLLPTKEAAA